MTTVSMKSLLEAGVHFGHQTKRWDPRMKKYIFTQRNGIHIIDLQKTVLCLKDAYMEAKELVVNKKSILFVGTKKQAQEVIKTEAERCGMHFVNHRWLGGMLTNFSTIKRSLYRLKKLEKMEIDGSFDSITKKEISLIQKEKERLEKTLGGIKEMKDLPGAIFVVDTRKEHIAIAEANRLNIPVIAILDTNCNPDGISYPIPGNDDAIRAIQLFTQTISSAVLDAENEIGLEVIESMHEEEVGFLTPAEEQANYQAQQQDSEKEVYDSQNEGEGPSSPAPAQSQAPASPASEPSPELSPEPSKAQSKEPASPAAKSSQTPSQEPNKEQSKEPIKKTIKKQSKEPASLASKPSKVPSPEPSKGSSKEQSKEPVSPDSESSQEESKEPVKEQSQEPKEPSQERGKEEA